MIKGLYSTLLSQGKYEQLEALVKESKREAEWKYFNEEKTAFGKYLEDNLFRLDFLEEITDRRERAMVDMGVLYGMLEAYKILRKEESSNEAASIEFAEKHAIKHYDDVIAELAKDELLNHSQLCERLSLKESTLSELMKKMISTGTVAGRKLGKYKYYSLTDMGRRYNRLNKYSELPMAATMVSEQPAKTFKVPVNSETAVRKVSIAKAEADRLKGASGSISKEQLFCLLEQCLKGYKSVELGNRSVVAAKKKGISKKLKETG